MPLPRPITRREFLYTTWLSLLALSFRPLAQILTSWQPEEPPYPRLLGRVTRREVAVYTQPDLDSPRSANLDCLRRAGSHQGGQGLDRQTIHDHADWRIPGEPQVPLQAHGGRRINQRHTGI